MEVLFFRFMKGFSVLSYSLVLRQNSLLKCLKKEICLVQKTKILFQNLAKQIGLSVYGGRIRKDINEVYKCVTETWMRENFDDTVKE